MKHFLSILFLSVITLALTSCAEDGNVTVTDVAITVTPSSDSICSISSGDKLKYEMKFYTSHDGYVKRVKVQSFDSENGEMLVCDKEFEAGEQTADFIYSAPEFLKDSVRVDLKIQGWDNLGNRTVDIHRYVDVKSASVLIPEMSGIVLYLADGYRNALQFADPTQTFSAGTPQDSARADMYVAVNELGGISLCSNTNARFVRNNSYMYPSATSTGLQSVYENSINQSQIDDIQVNDIILVGHSGLVEGILFVTNIIRQGSDNERCLQLSFKAIKRKRA